MPARARSAILTSRLKQVKSLVNDNSNTTPPVERQGVNEPAVSDTDTDTAVDVDEGEDEAIDVDGAGGSEKW